MMVRWRPHLRAQPSPCGVAWSGLSCQGHDYQQRTERTHIEPSVQIWTAAGQSLFAVGAVGVPFQTACTTLTADLQGWSKRTGGRFDGTRKIFNLLRPRN